MLSMENNNKDMMKMIDMTKKKRVVVKVGTSTLTHSTGLLNIRRVEQLVKTLADLQNAGHEIILVSSGAVGLGRAKLGIKEITQRGDKMLFFVKTAEVEQIQALYGAYKNRIRFFDGDKPYFAVTLEKKQKAAELMAETVRLMRNEE